MPVNKRSLLTALRLISKTVNKNTNNYDDELLKNEIFYIFFH